MPKKGNSTALDNQRVIALTCSSAKLFRKVLLSRLKPLIDPQLSQRQSGFRAGRLTTEQVMALTCAIDICRVTNMTSSLVFVDFRKAFDTLNRSSITVILSQCNVPNCIISDIIKMYSDASICVSTELGPTEWFKTMSKTNKTMSKVSKNVECSFHRLESFAAEIGLTINCNKTKAMHLGQVSIRKARFTNGDPVNSCDKFEYLGVPTSNAQTAFRSRLSKAWAAATKLRSNLNSNANDAI